MAIQVQMGQSCEQMPWINVQDLYMLGFDTGRCGPDVTNRLDGTQPKPNTIWAIIGTTSKAQEIIGLGHACWAAGFLKAKNTQVLAVHLFPDVSKFPTVAIRTDSSKWLS